MPFFIIALVILIITIVAVVCVVIAQKNRYTQENAAGEAQFGPLMGAGKNRACQRVFSQGMSQVYQAFMDGVRMTDKFTILGTDQAGTLIDVKCPMSATSYGEKMRVTLRPLAANQTEVTITSNSNLGTEMLAKEKNSNNIYKVLQNANLRLTQPQQNFDQSYQGMPQQSFAQSQGMTQQTVNQAFQSAPQQPINQIYPGAQQAVNQTYQGTSQQPMNQTYPGASQQTVNILQTQNIEDSTKVIFCIRCGGKMKVPSDKGRLSVTCPRCGKVFLWG